mmetsp:Transcript_11904/g.30529  ORF Transcript_11904/g.30529 Transcript_11904/m.30529 type:complete len:203 (+) Transcript_11904:839-1447(+)
MLHSSSSVCSCARPRTWMLVSRASRANGSASWSLHCAIRTCARSELAICSSRLAGLPSATAVRAASWHSRISNSASASEPRPTSTCARTAIATNVSECCLPYTSCALTAASRASDSASSLCSLPRRLSAWASVVMQARVSGCLFPRSSRSPATTLPRISLALAVSPQASSLSATELAPRSIFSTSSVPEVLKEKARDMTVAC